MKHGGATGWAPGQIGDYEVLDELKAGGMGAVLLGRKHGPGGYERLAAIKIIRHELRAADALRSMFFDEAQLLAKLSHPAIATIFDFGEAEGTLYLAMEYVAGVRFRELIDKQPSPVIAARAIAAACRGLHAAHELADLEGAPLSVVHRDVSPENLMLTYDGQVKVIDFGIALVKGRQAPVTELGTIKGKPPYLSPEQVRNDALDRRTDVFSAAVVLHELLTGEQLFDGDSIYAVARSIEHAEIQPPSAAAPAVPGELDAIVLRALARDRQDRYPSAANLADALEAYAAIAGGETLQEFADRALGDEREAHRKWLAARLTAGAEPSGLTNIGRASGVMTAVPALPPVASPPSDEPAAGADARPAPHRTARHPGTFSAEHPPRHRATAGSTGKPPAGKRRRPAALAGALLLVALAGTLLYLDQTRTASPPAAGGAPADAGAVDAVPLVAGAADAAAAAREPIAVTVDAAAPTAAGHDARPRSSRATEPAAVARAPDAGPAPIPRRLDAGLAAPTEFGYLSVAADPFALVKLDGRDLGATPIIRAKVAVGNHVVTLLGPDTGALRDRREVTISAGKTVSIVLR